MFAAMCLGIGVDYAVHLCETFRRNRGDGLEEEAAAREALRTTGPAILVDALAVGLGFAVLLLSQAPANAYLGGLVATSIFGCLAVTLFVLPSLLVRLHRPVR